MNDWFKKSYSRILVDNHISEDDESFMKKYDPAGYVDMIKKAARDAGYITALIEFHMHAICKAAHW